MKEEDFKSNLLGQIGDRIVDKEEVARIQRENLFLILEELASKIRFTNTLGLSSALRLYRYLIEQTFNPQEYEYGESDLIDDLREDVPGDFITNEAVHLIRQRVHETIQAVQSLGGYIHPPSGEDLPPRDNPPSSSR